MCARGLVVNDDGKIIARTQPKFFNDYEVKGALPSHPFEVYKKLDGSLVIVSFYEGKPFFCTRGSFTSEQAVKAEKLYFISGTWPNQGEGGGLGWLPIQIFYMQNSVSDFRGEGVPRGVDDEFQIC